MKSNQLESAWICPFPIYATSYGIKKGSPYKKFFVHLFDQLRENGQLDLYAQRNALPRSECSHHKTEGDSLGMLKLTSLFLVLVLGVILSFIILFYEQLNQPKKFSSCQEVRKNNEIIENAIKGLIPLLSDSSLKNTEKHFEKYLEIIHEMKTNESTNISKENEER